MKTMSNSHENMELEDDVNTSQEENFKRENISNLSFNSLLNKSLVNSTQTQNDEIVPNSDLSNLNDDILTSIARSAFADMLWDQERNYLYKKAVKKVLNKLLADKLNDKLNLLDIGAGTGLLSMFMCRVVNEFFNNHPKLNQKNKKIIALEQFFYSYLSGKEIIRLNKMNDRINLIYKNSMSERLGQTEKCDFLVSEVFDTELIGEAALEIFRDAKRELLNDNALIVPKRAYIYCQLIESKFLTSGNLFRSIRIKDSDRTILLNHGDEINNCPGSCTQLNDMQLNSMHINEFKLLSDVKIAFTIDFENPPNQALDFNRIGFKLLNRPKQFSNVCVAVWWDLDMDQEGEIVLSCAPYWARNDVYYEKVFSGELVDDVLTFFKAEGQFKGLRNVEKELENLRDGCFADYSKVLNESSGQFPSIIEQNFEKLKLSCQWRDHWMQAVYFLPKDALKNPIIEQDTIEIQAFRNDYQFWFHHFTSTQIQKINDQKFNVQPACLCGYHRVYSRNQIRQINDYQSVNQMTISFSEVYKEYKTTKQKSSMLSSNAPVPTEDNNPSANSPCPFGENAAKRFKKDETCNVMCYGGMGIISLVIAKLVPESVIFLHNLTNACPFYKEIIYKERLENKFLGVPKCSNFENKIDILVKDSCTDLDKLPWLDVHQFLLTYRSLLARQIPLVLPNRINFKIIPVCFDHLWKIRYVIKKIDGLDLLPFHQMVDKALERESRKIEMYSLHEYDGIALASSQLLASIAVANMDSHKGDSNLTFDFNCEEIRQLLFDLYGLNEEEATRSIFDQQLDKVLPFRRSLTNITFVIWPEYHRLANTGPSSIKIDFSSRVNWNKLYKQAVYFMPELNRDYLNTVKHLKLSFNLNYDFTGSANVFELSHKNLSLV